MGWPRLQILTQCSTQCLQSLGQMLGTGCTGEPHCCLVRIANVRNLLSSDELRIAIALQIVAKIFVSTECRCGKTVDKVRLHWFSCSRIAGRFARHSVMNSILERSFTRINLPSTLKRVGLTAEAWWIDFEPWSKLSISGVFKGRRARHLPLPSPFKWIPSRCFAHKFRSVW